MHATTVLTFARRHVTADLGHSLRITLPSRKRWLTIIPVGIFVIVWAGVMPPIMVSAGTAIVNALRNHPTALGDSAFFIIFGLV